MVTHVIPKSFKVAHWLSAYRIHATNIWHWPTWIVGLYGFDVGENMDPMGVCHEENKLTAVNSVFFGFGVITLLFFP